MPANEITIDRVGHVSLYPFATRLNPDPIGVTAIASGNGQLLMNNNPRRLQAIITNLSGAPLFIGFNSLVGLTNSIYVPVYGGTLVMLIEEDGDIVQGEVWATTTISIAAVRTWEIYAV